MKKIILLPLLLLFIANISAQKKRTITGKVTDGKNAVENVNVSIIDKGIATNTNTEGRYEIAVETGDRLQYSYVGLKTITIRIEDVTRILNPVMIPDVTELDEVEVAASKRRSQGAMQEDYNNNKRKKK